MKEGKQYSFWQLISSEAILIPQIQRDYVQYRSGKVEINLKRFTNNLITAITNNQSINLNFIYGNKTVVYDNDACNPAFIPIDGQQRLTTLFLLHYYVFNETDIESKDMLKGRFYYKTRSTTQDFLNALILNNKKFHNSELQPSEIIKDSGWYSSLWNFDPSILSCLKVLDQIKNSFKNLCPSPDWNKLADLLRSDFCPITFMKLEIEGIDKPNELYIKMNSRGKQLTPFENFKTELYGYINETYEKTSTFKQNMDGDWLNFLWGLLYKNLGNNDDKKFDICKNHTDTFYRELLHWIIVNRACCYKALNEITDSFKDMFYAESPEIFYLSDYIKELDDDNFVDVLNDIYHTMNLLHDLEEPSVFESIFDLRYDDKDGFSSSINQYTQRTLIFAITRYATAKKIEIGELNKEDFLAWWRIVKNLVQNSQIDSIKTCLSALNAINEFQEIENIVSYLIGLDESDNNQKFIDLPALNPLQCQEEILKQKIISDSHIEEWKNTIYSAESHSYFNGEIFFVFKISGIENVESATQSNLAIFKDNWNKVTEIFDDSRNDIDIHRLLLVYGDYSKIITSYSDDSQIWSYYYNDTKHHNNDWRGLLRDVENLQLFEKMFTEFNLSGQTFSRFTNSKINSVKCISDTICEPKKQELHFYMITNPTLFEYIQAYGRCWYHNGLFKLLRTANRGSYVNYKLLIVFSELKNKGKNAKLQEGKGNDQDHIIIKDTHCYSDKDKLYIVEKNGNRIDNLTIEDAVNYLSKVN